MGFLGTEGVFPVTKAQTKGEEMKRWTVSLSLVVCVLMCFGVLWIGQAYSENEITAKGSVYGSEWNDKGEATAVSVVTTEGDELFVVHTPLGDELLKLVEQNVRVTGLVNVDQNGRKNLMLHKYEIAYN
jgi:hypothetical protein